LPAAQQMTTPAITSTANRHIVEARKLRQRKHRQEQGLFLIEGLQLLHMALDASLPVGPVFFCPEQFTGAQAPVLIERLQSSGGQLLRVSSQVMDALSDRDGPQGIVAAFHMFRTPLTALGTTGNRLVLVLDCPQDPGNLGGLIRTADAAGAAGVVILEPSVDLFDPRTIRASMGSLFNLPVVLTPDAPAALRHLAGQGLALIGASEHTGEPWGDTALTGPCALVLGNEARGLSDDVIPYIARWVSLPMPGKAESLNVSVAGGVLMYAWLRINIP